MASILKHKDKWRAFIRVNGRKLSKVFDTKNEANRWIKQIEKEEFDQINSSGMTFSDLLEEYKEKESPKKRGVSEEIRRINALQKEVLASVPLIALNPEIIQNWVDTKKQQISKQTGRKLKTSSVARYLTIIKAACTYAVKTKRFAKSPAEGVECRVEEDSRERIATEEEIEALKVAAQWSEDEPPVKLSQRLIAAFIFCCFTGMRIGEVEKMERSWIHECSIKIPREATKTFHSRTVAVPNRAKAILDLVMGLNLGDRVFGLKEKQHDGLFRKIRNHAGLSAVYDSNGHEIHQALNFHDSRATFCTWAASPGHDGAPRLDVLALAKQTGHRNFKMLMKYYRKDPTDLLSRLNE